MLVGDVKDSYVDTLNRFLVNLEVLSEVLQDYHFPLVVTQVLMVPLWLPIKLLNLMKGELTWWILCFILCAIGLVFVGCAVALFHIVLKGTIAYRQQHPDEDAASEGASSAQHEGGTCTSFDGGLRDDDDLFQRKYNNNEEFDDTWEQLGHSSSPSSTMNQS